MDGRIQAAADPFGPARAGCLSSRIVRLTFGRIDTEVDPRTTGDAGRRGGRYDTVGPICGNSGISRDHGQAGSCIDPITFLRPDMMMSVPPSVMMPSVMLAMMRVVMRLVVLRCLLLSRRTRPDGIGPGLIRLVLGTRLTEVLLVGVGVFRLAWGLWG